jgi:hypothetical protein
MPSDLATPIMEQHCIIRFLPKGKGKSAENLHRLNVQYWKEILSYASVCDWYSKFSEGHEVWNVPHIYVQPVAVRDVNSSEELIFGNIRITEHDIASNSGMSVGSVETIIYEHLLF